MDTFPFQDLPILVQYKIMRQYIPLLCKTQTLYDFPELSDLLEYPQSWLNFSAEFFKLFHLIRSLKPGLYVNKKMWWSFCFFVVIEEHKIIFHCISLYDCLINDPSKTSSHATEKSLSFIIEFLTEFLEHYRRDGHNIINIYNLCSVCVIPCRRFLINISNNTLYYEDNKVYPFKNKQCIIKNYPLPNNTIQITQLKNDVIYKNVYHGYEIETQCEKKLKPISLLDQCTQGTHTSCFTLEFQIIEDRYVRIRKEATQNWVSLKVNHHSAFEDSPSARDMLTVE